MFRAKGGENFDEEQRKKLSNLKHQIFKKLIKKTYFFRSSSPASQTKLCSRKYFPQKHDIKTAM